MDSLDDYLIPYGLMAEFDTPADAMHAAEQVVVMPSPVGMYTPYPVHEMDDAMGLGNSKVGWFTFCCGLSGFFGGMLMIWYMNAYDYGIPVGGKPNFVRLPPSRWRTR